MAASKRLINGYNVSIENGSKLTLVNIVTCDVYNGILRGEYLGECYSCQINEEEILRFRLCWDGFFGGNIAVPVMDDFEESIPCILTKVGGEEPTPPKKDPILRPAIAILKQELNGVQVLDLYMTDSIADVKSGKVKCYGPYPIGENHNTWAQMASMIIDAEDYGFSGYTVVNSEIIRDFVL